METVVVVVLAFVVLKGFDPEEVTRVKVAVCLILYVQDCHWRRNCLSLDVQRLVSMNPFHWISIPVKLDFVRCSQVSCCLSLLLSSHLLAAATPKGNISCGGTDFRLMVTGSVSRV